MNRTLLLAWLLILAGVACAQQATARRPAITGISHMSLYADDLAKSQQFYSSLLGWVQSPAGGVQSGVRFYANHLQYIELISPPARGWKIVFRSSAFQPVTLRPCAGFLLQME